MSIRCLGKLNFHFPFKSLNIKAILLFQSKQSIERDSLRVRKGGPYLLQGHQATEICRDHRPPNWFEELRSPKGQAFLWHRQVCCTPFAMGQSMVLHWRTLTQGLKNWVDEATR